MARRRRQQGHPAKVAARAAEAERKARERQTRSIAGGTEPYVRGYVEAALAMEAAFGPEFRSLAWGTMIYACLGPRPSPESAGCGWEHRVWMGVGVEGPTRLPEGAPTVERLAFVPAPMFCGTCPDCGGMLGHDRWPDDEEWAVPREIPGLPGVKGEPVAYFAVPTALEAERLAARDYGGGDYFDPTGRTAAPRAGGTA